MTTQVLFNQFGYVDHLKRGGFTEEQARASAEALAGALSETVATKHDIERLEMRIGSFETATKHDVHSLEGRIATLEHKLVAEIHATVYKAFGALAALIGLVSGMAALAAKFWTH